MSGAEHGVSVQVIQAQPALPVAPVKQVAMPVPPAAAVPFAPRPLDVSRPGSAHDHASYYLQVHKAFLCNKDWAMSQP